jgi:hypothetical protein
LESLWLVIYTNIGFIPYYIANKNKLSESEEILPEEPTIIDEEAMAKLTNKIKNAIIHYIMISWDELHKLDQPPIITKIIEDEIEVTEEKVEKNFDEIPLSNIDSNENSFIRFGEEEQPKQLIQSASFNTEKSEVSMKMNEGKLN